MFSEVKLKYWVQFELFTISLKFKVFRFKLVNYNKSKVAYKWNESQFLVLTNLVTDLQYNQTDKFVSVLNMSSQFILYT